MSAMLAPATVPSTGCRLVTTDGRALPFRGGSIAVDACAGLARVTLRQTFHNPYDEPLRVTYQVPLPADAATSGYAFELDGRRIVGTIEGREAARERFEEALSEGRTAALLEEDRSSLFTQEVGNIPPGAEVVCELILDQPLRWASGWEWRFPTVVAPRFLGRPGRVTDGDRVVVDVSEDAGPSIALSLRIRDARTGAVTSPSHSLHIHGDDVRLAAESVPLDRDVVVRWPVAAARAGATLDVARPDGDRAFGLLTLVPPTATTDALPRDLIVLIDTSGSMGGRPLDQAREVVAALIDTLTPADTLELVEFSNRPRRWKRKAAKVTEKVAAEACAWVRGLRASGGTMMRDGIIEALRGVRRESRRQVLVVTDGLIGFEKEIIQEIRDRLPAGSRVHTLGIGSSTNRTLLRYAARAGGGIETIVGLSEDPAEAARALVAATDAPVVVDLELSGSALKETACTRPADLMAGRPTQVAVALHPAGGELIVRGRAVTGTWEQRLSVAPTDPGAGSPAVTTLFGRERVEELELEAATGVDRDAEIEAVGLAFRIATRRTSWVAVADVTVDPGLPTRRETVAQALPHGMSAQGLGLRREAAVAFGGGPMMELMASAPAGPMAPPPPQRAAGNAKRSRRQAPKGVFSKLFRRSPPPPPAPEPVSTKAEDFEVDALEADLFEEAEVGGVLGGWVEGAGLDGPEVVGTARIVAGKGDRLVFEIRLYGARWDAPTSLRLDLGDRTVEVTLVAERSTKAGPVPPGAVVRALVVGDGAGALRGLVQALRFEAAGGHAVITVDRG